MTRSSTNELFTPFKYPEQEFRSSMKHFKTLSLDESRSPDFDLFSDQEEYSDEEVSKTMAETMEQYMIKTRADYGSGVARPKIKDKDNFKLKGQFLKELHTNTFSGSDHEDANEHIEKVLEILDLFHILNITINQVTLGAFPMSLTGAASRWLRNKPSGSITTWGDLKTKFLSKYCPPARTAKKMEEINKFQQELDENLYQAWEQFKELLMKAIPLKSTADAKVPIQEMAKYSQIWHNGTSRTKNFNILDMLEDIKVPLILKRPFLSTAHAKIDAFKMRITLREDGQDVAHIVAASKVPMLKLREFEIWRIRIEQYILMIDYYLWGVIENDKAQRRLEVKAMSTLMMGIPNEQQLKFNSIKDAKSLLEAIKKRFDGNDATKKTQKNLLKQQYENFTASSSESLDQTFDRLQKLVSQLEILKESISQEDVNQKFLRCLPSEWNMHVYEPEVKGVSSSSTNTQNMAFVSFSLNNNTNNSNEVVNTAFGVTTAGTRVNAANSTNIDYLSDAIICAFLASQSNSSQLVNEDLEQIRPDDLVEIDIKWQMAMLIMRARRFLKNIGRKLNLNRNETASFDKTKVKCYNCHKRVHFEKECRAPRAQDNRNRESTRRNVLVETTNSSALVSCDGIRESNKLIDSQIMDNCKKGLGYDAVPPPHIAVTVNTARPVNTVHPETTMNAAEPRPKVVVNTARPKAVVNTASPKAVLNAVKGNENKDSGRDLRIRFSKNTPNNVGSGPNWLFDIDALTKTMNYQPIVASTQSNGNACTKDNNNAEPKSSQDAGFKPSNDVGKKVNEVPRQENECKDQEEKDSVNNTNRVNVVRLTVNSASNEVNAVDSNKDVFSAEADLNNLESTFQVSHIPTTRIYKDHPLEQIIGDLHSAPQTRRMSKNLEEHGLVSTVNQRTNHKDLQNYLFACFLSQKEPKKVIHALKDPRWIEAMQEELLQFKLQEVWTLVDLPYGKRVIGTKWVFRNKKDERDFMVYQMDVKSAFLYENIKEDVYVCQAPGFEDLGFPDKVYKVYYMDFIKLLEHEVKNVSTPIETQKPLLKDEDGKEVDVHMKQKPRKTKKNDTQVPQLSMPTKFVIDEAVNKEMDDRLMRAATIAYSLEAKQDSATKTTQAKGNCSLKRIVKKLKKKQRSRTHKLKRLYKFGLSARVESSNDEGLEMFDADKDLQGKEVVVEQEVVTDKEPIVDAEQDKGKAKMIEEPVKLKKKDQILFDEEVARKLQEEINEEERLVGERARQEEETNIALIKTWENIQAKVDANYQLVERMQAEEQ
nr:hypothetical protein [Tanacetum cinerariifolium]